ncbi:MAG: hypothetical protein K8L97_30750 [Anaerolineae bacterium]|nr:hypothetical protein [Anaerolineae bacterium]
MLRPHHYPPPKSPTWRTWRRQASLTASPPKMHKIPFEIEESDEFAEICESYQPIRVAQTLSDTDDDDKTLYHPLRANDLFPSPSCTQRWGEG